MGQHPAPVRRGRGHEHRSGAERHDRTPDAQPIPRMGPVHDRDAAGRGRPPGNDGNRGATGGEMSFPAKADLVDFVYDEARMLDEGRFAEWLTLWLPEGHYWMPL